MLNRVSNVSDGRAGVQDVRKSIANIIDIWCQTFQYERREGTIRLAVSLDPSSGTKSPKIMTAMNRSKREPGRIVRRRRDPITSKRLKNC